MKCQICKTKESLPNSIVCSNRCAEIRKYYIRLSEVVTPTNGCDNCHGDLHQGCTVACKQEYELSNKFMTELITLIRKYT